MFYPSLFSQNRKLKNSADLSDFSGIIFIRQFLRPLHASWRLANPRENVWLLLYELLNPNFADIRYVF